MKKTNPRFKFIALISTIISTVAIALVIVFSVCFFNDIAKKKIITVDDSYKVKGDINLDNKVGTELMLFTYNDSTLTASFSGLASFPQDAYKTLEIPETIEKDNKTYTVTSIKNMEFTTTKYEPKNYGQTHDANGNYKPTYYSTLFYYGQYLTALIIPDTVTEIEEGALYGLASIEYLKTPFIGTGIASNKPIGSMFSVGYYNEDADANYHYPFMIVKKDNDVENHYNVSYKMEWYETTVNSTYFYNVPSNLENIIITKETSIGTRAFIGMASVHSISLPNTLTTVKQYAFNKLTGLTSINLPDSIQQPAVGWFADCSSLTQIILPHKITGIADNTFGGCTNLETIYIPSSVTRIGQEAFERCHELENIKVFYSNTDYTNLITSTESVNFPLGLTEIGKYAFKECSSIELMRIPNNVTFIGEGAFAGMTSLGELYIPFVGKQRGNTGADATIGYMFGNHNYGDCYQVTQAETPRRVPSSLYKIIVTDETFIAEDAFKNLSNQANIEKGVSTIIINENVTYIADKAFAGCASLVNITLPFAGVGNKSELKDNKSNIYFSKIFGTDSLTGLEIDDKTKEGTERYVPISLKNIVITNQTIFYTGTFKCLNYIKSVEIYPVATEIEEALFYKNDALESLNLPFVGWIRGDWYRSYTWWYTLMRRNQFSWVFSEKSHGDTYADETIRYYTSYIRYVPNNLKYITITDEDYIGPYAFKNLTSVTHLSIENSDNNPNFEIARGSASGMNSLKELIIPFIGNKLNTGGDAGASHSLGWIFGTDGNETYSYKAYEYDTYYIPRTLDTVKVDKIGKLPNYSLANLTSLSTIEFNQPVTEVGSYAFYNDTGLSSYKYASGTSFTNVGDYAFYNNLKLNDIGTAVPKYKTLTSQSSDGLVFGAHAFGKSAISSIDFEKIKKVGIYCFEGCFKLTNVDVTTNVEVADGLFSRCVNLTDINLALGKATNYMFEYCTSLVNANIVEGTTYEDLATNVTKYYIPDGMFRGCQGLVWGGITSSSNGGLIINSQITSIGKAAFEGCTNLNSFTIPDNVVEISDYAFYGVDKFNIMLIPVAVKKIGVNVFKKDIGHGFGIWVHDPKEKWPQGWTTGWNCLNPVYVIPGIDDSIYEFKFSSQLQGYVITGIKSEFSGSLNGRLNLPRLHNYVDVVGVDSNVFIHENIEQFIIPSSIRYFGDNALSTGKRTDLYFERLTKYNNDLYFIEKDPSQDNIYVIQKKNSVDKKVKSDYKSLIPNGYIFYGDYWQYGTGEADEYNIPYLIANKLEFEFKDFSFTYNGQAWTPEIKSVHTSAVVVRNENIEVLNNTLSANLFNYSYKNNVLAGEATVNAVLNANNYNEYLLGDKAFKIAGSAVFNFTIEKAPINIWYTATEEDKIHRFEKVYDEKAFEESVWGTHNVQGLPDNYILYGRIATTSADAGTYIIAGEPYNSDFYWESPYIIRRNGHDVTANFIPQVFMQVTIDPLEVNLDWTNCEKVYDQYDNVDYLKYQYTGKVVVPTAAAYKLDGTPVPHCITDTFVYDINGIYPDLPPSTPSKYHTKARISQYSANNYKIMNSISEDDLSIEQDYIIVNRELTLTIKDNNYLIPINAISYSYPINVANLTESDHVVVDPYSEYSSITIDGLQSGSHLVGEVVTVANEYHMGDHDNNPDTPIAPMANKNETYTTENDSVGWKTNTITLANYLDPESGETTKSYEDSDQPDLPWFIYRYNEQTRKLEIENKYYNVHLDASVSIFYNKFIIDYVVDGELLKLGNPISIDNKIEYPTTYEVDGNIHKVYPVIKNKGIMPGDYKVNYGDDIYTTEIPTLYDLGINSIGIQVSRTNFDNDYKIIRIECIKSNVKYDLSLLNREYNGEPVPTFDENGMAGDTPFITKKALDTDLTEEDIPKKQTFKFEYCNLNKGVIPAPVAPGNYLIHIEAPGTYFFNPTNIYQPFTITPRMLEIYVNHMDVLDPSSPVRQAVEYDGSPVSITIDTSVAGSRGKLLGVASDEDGKDTRHQLKGTFATRSQYPGVYSGDNANDFIWTTSWNVYSLQLGNIKSYYDVKFIGDIKIDQKEPEFDVAEPYDGPFDGIPHGLKITVNDPDPSQASILYSLVEINETNDGPSAEWSPVCPMFTNPGSYTIWYKIIAGLIPNTEGETTYKTKYGQATINIYSLIFETEKPDELTIYPTGPEEYYIDYDGEEHKIEAVVTNHPTPTVQYNLYKDTVNIYSGNVAPKVVELGTYTLIITISADFYIEKEITYTFKITDEYLADIPSISSENVNVVFNGNAQYINVLVEGLPNDVEYTIKYEVNDSGTWSDYNPTFTDAGVYNVRYLVQAKGYKVATDLRTVTITPASFDGLVTVQGYDGPYTATSHKIEITGIPLIAKNVCIYYTDNFDVTYLPITSDAWMTDPDLFAYTDVTTAKAIYFTITADNYKNYSGVGYIKIDKVQLEPSFEDGKEIQYSASPLKISQLEIDTIHDGYPSVKYYNATVNSLGKYTYNANDLIDAPTMLGTYYFVIDYSDTGNCFPAHVEGGFKIVPRVVTVNYESTVEYNGKEHGPNPQVITGTPDELFIIATRKDGVSTLPVEIGDYEFTFAFSQSQVNYVLPDDCKNITFSITKINLLIQFVAQKNYKNDEIWTKTSDWTSWSGKETWNYFTSKLLQGHEFNSVMETSSYVRGTYVYSTLSQPSTSYVVNVNNTNITDAAGNDVSYLYDISYDIIVKIVYPTIEYNLINYDEPYDGYSHSIEFSFGPNIDSNKITIYYCTETSYESENPYWTTIPPTRDTIGSEKVYYQFISSSYENLEGFGTITITKAHLDIEIDDYNNVYDAYNHYVTFNVVNASVDDSIAKKDYYRKDEVSFENLTDLYEAFDESNPNYYLYEDYRRSEMKDAGEYYAVVYYLDATNWYFSYAIKEVTIEQRGITFDLITPRPMYESNYNGLKYGEEKSKYILIGDAIFDPTELIQGHSMLYAAEFGDLMRANKNYSVRTVSPNAGYYYGTYYVDMFENQYNSHGFEFNNMKILDVATKEDVTKNYYPIFDDNELIVRINRIALPKFEVANPDSKEYDGQAPKPAVIDPVSDGALKYRYYEYDNDGKLISTEIKEADATNVGKYRVYVSIANGTNYYAWPTEVISEFEIMPRNTEVVWVDNEVTFNGDYQAPKAYFIDAFGLEQFVDVHMFNSDGFYEELLKSGTYEAFVKEDPTLFNYNLTNTNSLFVINKLEKDIVVDESTNVTDTLWTYLFDQEDVELPAGIVITNAAGNGKAVLSTKNSAGGYYEGNENFVLDILAKTVKKNIEIDVTDSILFNIVGTVKIIPKVITFEIPELIEIEYDGSDHYLKNYLKITNPSNATPTVTYSYTSSSNGSAVSIENLSFVNVDTYSVSFNIHHDDYDKDVQGSTTIVIYNKKSFINFTKDLSRDFDGNEVDRTMVLSALTGEWNHETKDYLVITFFEYGSTEPMQGNPLNAGIYEAVITVKDDDVSLGHTILNESVVFEIRPRIIDLNINTSIEIPKADKMLQDISWFYKNGTFDEAQGKLDITGVDLSVGYTTKNEASDVLLFEIDGTNSLIGRGVFNRTNLKLTSVEKSSGDNISYDTSTTILFDKAGLLGVDFVWNVRSSSLKDNQTQKYVDVTKNYGLNLTITLNVHLPYMEVEIEDIEGDYTGDYYYHTIDDLNIIKPYPVPEGADMYQYYASNPASLDLIYEMGPSASMNIEDVKYNMPGNYPVYYLIEIDDFEPYTGVFNIKIGKDVRTITFDSDSLNKTYDGNPAGVKNPSTQYYLPSYNYNYLNNATQLPDVDVATEMQVLYKNIYSSIWTTTAIDAGEYDYRVIIPESANYAETQFDGHFRIERKLIYLTGSYNAGYTGSPIQYNNFSSTNTNFKFYTYENNQLKDITVLSKYKFVLTIRPDSVEQGVYSGNHIDYVVDNGKSYFVYYDGVDVSRNYEITKNGILKPESEQTESDKYLITPATISITPGDMNVDINNVICTYNGTKQYLEVSVKKPDITNPSNASKTRIYYSLDGIDYSETPIGYTERGTYTIYVKVTNPNFNDNISEVTFVINPMQTMITFDVPDRYYNGDKVHIPVITSNYPEGQDTSNTWVYTFYEYDGNDIETATSLGSINPVNAGHYILEIMDSQSNTSNYSGGIFKDFFEIKPISADIVWSKTSYIYNGTVQKPTASLENQVENDNIVITYTVNNISNGDKDSISAGGYEITASLAYPGITLSPLKNYEFDQDALKNFTCQYDIVQREVTLMLNQTRKYNDGNVFSFEFNEKDENNKVIGYTVSNLVDGHTFAGSTLKTNTGTVGERTSITDFNWTSGNGSTYAIVDADGKDVTNNYAVKSNVYFGIDHADIEVAHIDYVGDYDDQLHTAKVQALNLAEVVFYYSMDGQKYQSQIYTFKDAGNYSFWVKATADGYNERIDQVHVTINPKKVALDFENPFVQLSKDYDGNPVVNPVMTYADKEKQTLNFTYTYYRAKYDSSGNVLRDEFDKIIYDTDNPISNPSGVGYYLLNVAIINLSKNYLDATATKEFRIKKVDLVIEFSELVPTNKATKQFDGLSWSMGLNDDNIKTTGLVSGEIIQGSVQTNSANVGEYNISSDFDLVNNFKILNGVADTTKNYNIITKLDVSITLADITYEAFDFEAEYDGANHNIIINVSKPSTDYLIEYSIDHSPSRVYKQNISLKNTGKYTVYFRITAENYKEEIGNRLLTIHGVDTPVDVDYVSSYEYSGNAYSTDELSKITINTLSNGAQTIKFYQADGVTELPTPPTEPGSYKFKVHVDEYEGFNEINSTKSFVITKKKVLLVWDDLLFEYDGLSHLPSTAYFTDVFNNIHYADILNADAKVNAGSYVVHAVVANDPHYIINNDVTTFIIQQKEIVIPEIDPDMEFTYKFEGDYLDSENNLVHYSFGDDIVIKDIDGNIYEVDNDGVILSITYINNPLDNNDDVKKVVGVDIEELPYKIKIDEDSNADGVKSPETDPHKLQLALISNNYCWKDLSDDKKNENVIVTYKINPYDFSDGKTKLAVEYVDDYYQMFDDNEKQPVINIVVKNSENIVIKKLLVSAELPNYPEYEIVKYENNKNLTTKDNPALIYVSGANNFKFNMTVKFEIVKQPPTLLTLKSDATVQFIEATFIDGMVTINEESTIERNVPSTPNVYLGHMHQSFTRNYILNQFANYSEIDKNIKIFSYFTGEELEVTNDEDTIGTNFEIRLYDTGGEVIDTIRTILYGDLNCDGNINGQDYNQLLKINQSILTYDDLELGYFAGMTRRDVDNPNGQCGKLLLEYNQFTNDDHDYNLNFKVKLD